MTMPGAKGGLAPAFLVLCVLAPLAASGGSHAAVARETAVAPEKNPPGDIPDNQVFVRYASPLGFSLEVPEGWSRSERADGVRFADKYNVIELTASKADAATEAAGARGREAADVKVAGRAVEIKSVTDTRLKAGPAVLIKYTSNSEPNPVTNRQIRLEHDRYLLFKDGTLVRLDLAAAAGADNADQWALMSNSFRWK